MARGDPQITSFSSGELSDYALGRVDAERYSRGAVSIKNFLIGPTGALFHRTGTQYVGATTAKAAMLPFVASTGTEFVLECVGTTTRVWYNATRTLVLDNAGTWNLGVGSPATLSTPWAAADLFDADGALRLKFVQINDVMWVVHPSYFPVKITRTDTYKFEWSYLSDGVNAATPFDDLNPSQTVTLQFGAATGATTCTASAGTFTAADAAGWLYVERPNVDNTVPWETNKSITSGDVRSSNGRYYAAANTATTQTVRPTHSIGTRIDGASGVQWAYQDDGYGIAAITGYVSPTVVNVTILKRIPNTCVSGGSTRWARGAWRASQGFPAGVALFRERLCFVRGQTLWTSVVGDFENFTATDGGQATADMAVTATFGSDRNDRAKWCAANQAALVIGTASGELACSEQTSSEPFGPGNVRVSRVSGYGVSGAQPLPIGNSLMFVERGARKTREMRYSIEVESFASRDLNVYADHIFARCSALAHQRVPFGVVWAIDVSGQLKAMTYQAEQEVWAWAQHTLGGRGLGLGTLPKVVSMAVVTSPDGVHDDLWLCVERQIGSSIVYYIEVLGPHLSWTALGYVTVDQVTDPKDAAHLDCQVQKFLLAGATTVTGLAHLEGESVACVADGALTTMATTVASSAISIAVQDDACRAWVGFPRNADIIPAPPAGPPVAGTSQAKRTRTTHLGARVVRSSGFVFGKPGGTLDRVTVRKQSDDMSSATPLRSGDYLMPFPAGTYEPEERPEMLIRQDQPLPLIVTGVFPRMTVEG
jgi:hypothetical protein